MEIRYRYRIYPNKNQKELIEKTFGCCRYVYNYFLHLRIEERKNGKPYLTFYDTIKLLTPLKNENIWLKEPDKDALQKSLQDLDNAYKKFFREGNKFPKFKKKHENRQSYRTSCTYNNIRWENKRIKLPKIGWLKTRDKRIPKGRILHASIIRERNGQYYCTLCCTDVKLDAKPKTLNNVGIDVGLAQFATFSNGIMIENPRFYNNEEKQIARLQRELARKQIGSSNWNKSRLKLARKYAHVANQNKDFLQKLTTSIINNYDIICLEDLNIQDMKQINNKTIRRNIGKVSWYKFRMFLEYKAKWYNKEVIIIDRYFPSSQICSCCGYKSGKKELNVRSWICPQCQTQHDRDINAAINILNEGIKKRTVGTTELAW
nr:MAG TPA: endonuclease [Caudoviricetes sp.]